MSKSVIEIYNEDCNITLDRFINDNNKVDLILTSPPYNTTSRTTNTEISINNYDSRYDIYFDVKSSDEYCDWCVDLFNKFDRVLNKNGVILWNISYGTNFTASGKDSIGVMWLVIADILRKTNFTIADKIVWKKKSALPNNASPNKLTRIVEDIFVFCRRDEIFTFNCNKKFVSKSNVGQNFYENIYNFIEADNNDGPCTLNKATYSSELCRKLLKIYASKNTTVYDPFMGSGTTAVACKQFGLNCFGSELSSEQCKYAKNRLKKIYEFLIK